MATVLGLGKTKIERMCRAAGVVPCDRRTVNGREVFIADGFSATPEVTFQKFDVERADFPLGCYATFWWIFESDEKMSLGRPLFFDFLHDPGHSAESKKKMRIAAAVKDAETTLIAQKRATKH